MIAFAVGRDFVAESDQKELKLAAFHLIEHHRRLVEDSSAKFRRGNIRSAPQPRIRRIGKAAVKFDLRAPIQPRFDGERVAERL